MPLALLRAQAGCKTCLDGAFCSRKHGMLTVVTRKRTLTSESGACSSGIRSSGHISGDSTSPSAGSVSRNGPSVAFTLESVCTLRSHAAAAFCSQCIIQN